MFYTKGHSGCSWVLHDGHFKSLQTCSKLSLFCVNHLKPTLRYLTISQAPFLFACRVTQIQWQVHLHSASWTTIDGSAHLCGRLLGYCNHRCCNIVPSGVGTQLVSLHRTCTKNELSLKTDIILHSSCHLHMANSASQYAGQWCLWLKD